PRIVGLAYLPDFRVQHQPRFPRDMYFEAKPTNYESADTEKPDALAALHLPVGFLHHPRVPRAMHDACEHEIFFGGSWDVSHGFCRCSCCGAIGYEFEGRSERMQCACNLDEGHTDVADELVSAYAAALTRSF